MKWILAISFVLVAASAEAALIINAIEFPADVVISSEQGTLDLTGLTPTVGANLDAAIFPLGGSITLGGLPTVPLPTDFYSGATAPGAFGSGLGRFR